MQIIPGFFLLLLWNIDMTHVECFLINVWYIFFFVIFILILVLSQRQLVLHLNWFLYLLEFILLWKIRIQVITNFNEYQTDLSFFLLLPFIPSVKSITWNHIKLSTIKFPTIFDLMILLFEFNYFVSTSGYLNICMRISAKEFVYGNICPVCKT